MEIVRLTSKNFSEVVLEAAEVLRHGGIVLYPTETLYGLGTDALSDEAVAKVYAIKGRETRKPIHCVVADLPMAETYAEVDEVARKLAKEFLPGPLTLILKKKQGLDSGIGKGIETIGIRIPQNEFCLALAREFGKPYTTTSANRSGREPARSVADILSELEDSGKKINLVVDGGDPPAGGAERKPSTVVDISSGSPLLLREGAIPASEIMDVLDLPLPEIIG